MNCIKCGSPVEADQVCEKCKGASGPEAKTVDPPVTSAEEGQAVVSPAIPTWASVRILLAASIAFSLAFVTYRTIISSEFVGYWLGSLLIPFGIAYLIAGRRSSRDWRKFSWIFLALGTFLPLMAFSGSRRTTLKPKAVAVESLRVATGAKKPEFSGTSTDQEMQQLSNAVAIRMIGYRREHDAKIAAIKDQLTNLYTAKSFSNNEEISRSVSAVGSALEADEELDRSIEHWRDDIKQDVNQSSLSDGDKQDFEKGVDKGLNGSDLIPLRRQATAAEEEWAKSSRDLYEFALRNRKQIIVRQDKLIIDDGNIRSEFNAKLRRSRELRDQLVSFNKQLAQKRADIAKQYGVKPDEFNPKN